jgi:hypothetical protein
LPKSGILSVWRGAFRERIRFMSEALKMILAIGGPLLLGVVLVYVMLPKDTARKQ